MENKNYFWNENSKELDLDALKKKEKTVETEAIKEIEEINAEETLDTREKTETIAAEIKDKTQDVPFGEDDESAVLDPTPSYEDVAEEKTDGLCQNDEEDVIVEDLYFYDKSAARKRFNLVGFGFAIFALVSYVVSLTLQYIALFAEMLTGVPVLESNLFLNAVTPISLYLFALPILIVFFAIFRVEGFAPQKRRLSFPMWGVILVVCFGLMYIGAYMGQFTMWGLSGLFNYDYSNMLNDIIDYNGMWITVIFVCIVAPIGEEFVFRKLIIDRTHKYGGAVSIFLSALMFGLVHANFYQFYYAFLIGLVLGYVYYSTGKVWYTIALHAVINFVGSVITAYISLGIEGFTEAIGNMLEFDLGAYLLVHAEYAPAIVAESMFTAFIFAAMVCAIAVPIILRKKIVLEREEMIPRGASFAVAFLNVGVVLMLFVYVVQFLQNIILPPLAELLVKLAGQAA